MIGISFADENDATYFFEMVVNRDKSVPPVENTLGASDSKSKGSAESINKKSGVFSGMGRKNSQPKGKINKNMISAPSDFQYSNLTQAC